MNPAIGKFGCARSLNIRHHQKFAILIERSAKFFKCFKAELLTTFCIGTHLRIRKRLEVTLSRIFLDRDPLILVVLKNIVVA